MRAIFAILLLIVSFASTAFAASPKVVASIAPLHSLVSAVMQGIGEPLLLVRGSNSPHTYSLRPSDARALAEADLIFWVGEDMEIFLKTPLSSIAANAIVISLAKAPALTLLPLSTQHDPHSGSANSDHTSPMDMHIWLDPDNAKSMLVEIERALSDLDPANAPAYLDNAQSTRLALDELNSEISAILAPIRGKTFLFYHDAYRYFEEAFAIFPAATITTNPEIRPGARTIAEMKLLIEQQDATCVFSEPQFASNIANMLVGDTDAISGALDPLGADIEPGPDLYFQLLRNMANAMKDCLSR